MLAARIRQIHDARKERESLVPLYEGEAEGINKKYREVSLVIIAGYVASRGREGWGL